MVITPPASRINAFGVKKSPPEITFANSSKVIVKTNK